MGRVFKPIVYKPLPDGAELFTRRGERFARWTDGRGRKRTAPVVVPRRGKHVGQERIAVESSRYWAQYRAADGLRQVPTECRDETAARGALRELERRVELVKGNLLSRSEAQTADHQTVPLAEHFDAYGEHLRVHVNRKTGFTATNRHRRIRRDHLNRVAKDMGWTKLADLDRAGLETWLAACEAEHMGAATRNHYAASWTAFGNWLVDSHRLIANPFGRLAKANERADCRRHRRALSEAELMRLLDATRRRPLAEYGREVVKVERDAEYHKRSNWTWAPITPDSMTAAEVKARKRLNDRPELAKKEIEQGRS